MKRKTRLLLLGCVFFIGITSAQNKVIGFCKIVIDPVKNGENIGVDYGKTNAAKWVKDSVIIDKLEKVKTFDNGMDAINYMNSIGWEFVSVIPMGWARYACCIKRK